MAQQLLLDLYGCEPSLLDDAKTLSTVAHRIAQSIGATILEENLHRFEPMGITYIAILSCSHMSIHTWPELGYVSLDVFSCAGDIPDSVCAEATRAFCASSDRARIVERHVGRSAP